MCCQSTVIANGPIWAISPKPLKEIKDLLVIFGLFLGDFAQKWPFTPTFDAMGRVGDGERGVHRSNGKRIMKKDANAHLYRLRSEPRA